MPSTDIIRHRRGWVRLVVLSAVFLAGCSGGEGSLGRFFEGPNATRPASRSLGFWEDRHRRINRIAAAGGIDLVFLGDSITQGWEREGAEIWQERFVPRRAANFGISGDRTQNVLWRIDHGNVDGIHPRLVVLNIGTNNVWDSTPRQAADGVLAIVDRLRQLLPETHVLLLAIFPRGEGPEDRQRAQNTEANRFIRDAADGDRVHFMDIGRIFLSPDGTIPPEIMPDQLHLSPRGYRLWADAIEGKVAELMGEISPPAPDATRRPGAPPPG